MEAQRAMHIQELKARVSREGYDIDAEAVAAAILRRWRLVSKGVAAATPRYAEHQPSAEVVKAG